MSCMLYMSLSSYNLLLYSLMCAKSVQLSTASKKSSPAPGTSPINQIDPSFPTDFLQEISQKKQEYETNRIHLNDLIENVPEAGGTLFSSLENSLKRQFTLMKNAGSNRLMGADSEELLEGAIDSVKKVMETAAELVALLSSLQRGLAMVAQSVHEGGRVLRHECSFCHAANPTAKCSKCLTINWARVIQHAARSKTPERPIKIAATSPAPADNPCPKCKAKLPEHSSYCLHCNSALTVRLCSLCKAAPVLGPSGRCKECSKRSQTPTFAYSQKGPCAICRNRDLQGREKCRHCG